MEEVKGRVLASLVKLVLVLGLLGCGGYYVYHNLSAPPTPTTKEVIEVLRSEELAFLVTHRVVTKVVVESRENNLLLGMREGYLMATVRLFFGVDFQRLPEDAVRREGDVIAITVPEPTQLDFSVDMDSLRFLSKKSGWMSLRDFLQKADLRQELQSQLQQAAMKMLREDHLLPTREELVRRMNTWAPAFEGKVGVKVVFR